MKIVGHSFQMTAQEAKNAMLSLGTKSPMDFGFVGKPMVLVPWVSVERLILQGSRQLLPVLAFSQCCAVSCRGLAC
jgi:hypothetical protein